MKVPNLKHIIYYQKLKLHNNNCVTCARMEDGKKVFKWLYKNVDFNCISFINGVTVSKWVFCSCPWNVSYNNEAFKSSRTNREYEITRHYTCESSHLVYLLKCDLCQKDYVGQTTFWTQWRYQEEGWWTSETFSWKPWSRFQLERWKNFEEINVDQIPP